MKKGTIKWLIISMFILIIIIIVVKSYSSLKSLNEEVINKEADINVQLNRKYEQVNKLKSVVEKYYGEDNEVLVSLINSLNTLKQSSNILEKSKVNDEITKSINIILENVENYEELINDDSYNTLIKELLTVEDRINIAKNNYNEAVDNYNGKVKGFPSSIIAKIAGYSSKEEFKTSEKIIIEMEK